MKFNYFYDLYRKDNDVNHIIDMAEFFKKFEDICATDVTSNIMKFDMIF